MSEPQSWDPTGDVLVVAHGLDPEVRADLVVRLAPATVTVLDRGPRDGATAGPDSAAEPGSPSATGDPSDAEQEFPSDSDATVAEITAALAQNPRITTLLAQSRWAARDIWRVVRPRPDLLGFTHIDNAERARRGALPIDVAPLGRRQASHRFALEFAGGDIPSWPKGARHRVLVGPGNDFGQALGWAQSARLLRATAALSVTVGDDGFPADLIATSADWSALSVRNKVLRLASDATHLLLDSSTSAATDLSGAFHGSVHDVAGIPPSVLPRNPETPVPHHVVVVGEGADPQTDWRITRLRELPRAIWASAVLSAGVIVDHRARFDALVARPMAQGAVLVTDPAVGVPSVPPGTDVYGDVRLRETLSRDTAAYVRDTCDPTRVARILRKHLGIRWWR